MTKIDFVNENRAYADSMTGSRLTDEELFNVIQKETGYDDSECDWLVELIREMEADSYADDAEEMIEELSWDVIVNFMDDDIREAICRELAPCSNEDFLKHYMARHFAAFGEDYKIN